MARLNTANPLVNEAARQKTGPKDQYSKYTHISPREETHTSGQCLKASAQNHKKSTNTAFDIFPDNDATEEGVKLAQKYGSPSMSPTKQKKKRTLKATHVNSILLPLQQGPRQRPAIKVETDDYEKENDIIEDLTETFDTTMESVLQRTPPRRSTAGTSSRSRPNDRPLSPLSPQTESADEECGDSSFNSLDDFIVSDNDEPSCNETSDSETEVEKSSTPSPPPKPTRRRLIRGRKPHPSTEEAGPKDSAVNELFSLDPQVPELVKSSAVKDSPRHLSQDDLHLSTKLNELNIDDDSAISSQLESDLTRSIMAVESPPTQAYTADKRLSKATEKKRIKSRSIMEVESPPTQAYTEDKRLATVLEKENDSHLSSRTLSPTLSDDVRISSTPHRESTDAFWTEDLINDFVDYHSPRKSQGLGSSVTELLREFDDTETEARSRDSAEPELRPAMAKKTPPARKTPSKTAIKKAAAAERRAEKERQAEFDENKAKFAKTFLKALDLAVTGGKVLEALKDTGGVPIVWSKLLRKTAGRASRTSETITVASESGDKPDVRLVKTRYKIELSERLIINEERILNTLTHEFCHILNYVISNIYDKPHGASFHTWGRRCIDAMKDHPLYGGGRIKVTTRHTYPIPYKYIWSCEGCKAQICRQSKCFKPESFICNLCGASWKQIKPKPRNV